MSGKESVSFYAKELSKAVKNDDSETNIWWYIHCLQSNLRDYVKVRGFNDEQINKLIKER